MEVIMGLRSSLNAARHHVHAHRLARTLAATPVAKRLSLCIVLAAFAVFAVAPATPAQALSLTKPEKKVLALVNHVRATHGLHKLKMVASLERASRAHSREMVGRDYFSHSSYSGESFSARLIRFGYTTAGCTRWTVGEDIACGSGSSGTPRAIFTAWMHSPPHRAVILTSRFRNVGLGRAIGTFRSISGVVFFTLDCGVRAR
jgi:uncharacterized protein YkwD